mmetsp:Transcript_18212/g.32384  ORF Transcript_18212/g.32384 Transcript_18212/m.32384 type:complete len:226 (+) Transcript_18212:2369-3046(+)
MAGACISLSCEKIPSHHSLGLTVEIVLLEPHLDCRVGALVQNVGGLTASFLQGLQFQVFRDVWVNFRQVQSFLWGHSFPTLDLCRFDSPGAVLNVVPRGNGLVTLSLQFLGSDVHIHVAGGELCKHRLNCLRAVLKEEVGTSNPMLTTVLKHIPCNQAAKAVRFGRFHIPELHLSNVLDLLVNILFHTTLFQHIDVPKTQVNNLVSMVQSLSSHLHLYCENGPIL